MSSLHFILASLRHHRRTQLSVALGVAVATAVLTGALLVGDSVRGSLRDLTLQRLGCIDHVIVSHEFFRSELATDLAVAKDFPAKFESAHPALLITGTLESGTGNEKTLATQVSVVGYDPAFPTLGEGFPAAGNDAKPGLLVTESLARELGVAAGDEVLLRVALPGAIPADSVLGEKADTTRARRLPITAVLPPDGLARFGLVPSQHSPRSAFVELEKLQELIDQPQRANAILVASRAASAASDEDASEALADSLQPKLIDYGIQVETIELGTGVDAIQISSNTLVLPDPLVSAARQLFGGETLQPVVTYLANTIRAGLRQIPYSTITGVDSVSTLGPLSDTEGSPITLEDDEIVLNSWAADDLGVQRGDEVRISYYEPESTHGELHEHPPESFRLREIVALKTGDGQPTAAADAKLTPEMAGVTDEDSISDWDLPFELVEEIRQRDEDYWDEYSTTPKAFVSLSTAKRMWPSRWGTISLLRLPATGDVTSESIARRLEESLDPASMGFSVLPVKRQGLQASAGTTPFDGLFLGFSLFLIAAAVMLIALLFQLGIQQRAAEVGILAATGVRRAQIGRLFGREALAVTAIGAAMGIVAGVVYAWLMITGLKTVWIDAIATPFLELHVTPRSLAIGWLTGVIVTWLTIRATLRQLLRHCVRRLLHGDLATSPRTRIRQARLSLITQIVLLTAAAGLAFIGVRLQNEAQAGTFFGCGAAVLAAALLQVHRWLRSGKSQLSGAGSFSLATLAMRNAARNPGRSTLTIGLVAAAGFLILAISAFRLDSSDAGTGGFELIATSAQPIHFDVNSPEGRFELGFSNQQSDILATWHIDSLRMHDGEEASCLSLYKPTQPRVLGVPAWSTVDAPFAWAATAIEHEDSADPWDALRTKLPPDDNGQPIIPVVLDMNTAMYSLQIYGGVGTTISIRDSRDRPITLQIVGLLKNSVLQGELLISEENFLRLFPDVSGYRFFLLRKTDVSQIGNEPSAVALRRATKLLESVLSDYGLDVVDAHRRLEEFLAVQNTYLSTFQSLGALGLLLGTAGLAIVQLRNVLQRRGELALMRAGGFRRSRLVFLVLFENGLLLGGGLLIGMFAAAVALAPHWAPQQASIPWATIAALVAIIAIVGTAAAWLATRRQLSAPIVPALRGE